MTWHGNCTAAALCSWRVLQCIGIQIFDGSTQLASKVPVVVQGSKQEGSADATSQPANR